MNYSLSSRFQGIFLGTAIGEAFSFNSSFSPPSDYLKFTIFGAESLIKLKTFNLAEWRVFSPQFLSKDDFTSGIIISCLPLMLLNHENLGKQRQNLQELLAILPKDQGRQDSTFAVGYALSLCLTEKLQPSTLIPKIIKYLGDSETSFINQLKQVQIFLEAGTGLDQVVMQLKRDTNVNNTLIALAFYCFLFTPSDFRLTITRAHRSNYYPQITSAIAGALSGAYNSIVGISPAWRLAFPQTNQLLQLSDRFFALWCGVYEPDSSDYMQIINAVAAINVIQTR